MYLLLGLFVAIAVPALVVTVRTIRFKPGIVSMYHADSLNIDTDKAAESLSEMIKCKTVSNTDKSLEDEGEFEKFKALLPRLFPTVFERCEYTEIGNRAILIKCCGKSCENPSVFMAHYDVVSAEEDNWPYPAFSGEIAEDAVWGRGALDTKSTLNAPMFALENLLKDGFVPERDVYMAFGGDEEINGHGASDIVDYFEKNGINPSLVLDEGGAVVGGVFPGVNKPAALVGIAEKGIMNVELSARSNGGHASCPPAKTTVGELARACVKILKNPFPMNISPAAAALFDSLAPHSKLLYRVIFANLWLFSPVLSYITRKSGGEMNALVRTTVAFTQMQGSNGMNVLPSEAKLVANIRIAPGETAETVIKRLARICGEQISVKMLYGTNPSPISDTKCEGYHTLCEAITQTWSGVIVAPYLMVACSDSRHWGRISDKVFRFSPMELVGAERGTVHGRGEHIPLSTVAKTVEFYLRLISKM